MKSRQFRKWLEARGVVVTPGKGGHQRLEYRGRRSVLPMHSQDLKKGLVEGIKKQLGIKE